MKRSRFNLSHQNMLTFNMGYLYPIGLYDVLPGDIVNLKTQALLRFTPMLAPVMSQMECHIHHWYVPYRLMWPDFGNFITGSDTSLESPYINSSIREKSLWDYFGFGITVGSDGKTFDPTKKVRFSAFPGYAFKMIYSEFYRDQDLQNANNAKLDYYTANFDKLKSGSNDDLFEKWSLDSGGPGLPFISYSKDYFTTARPYNDQENEVLVPVDVKFSSNDSALSLVPGTTSGRNGATPNAYLYSGIRTDLGSGSGSGSSDSQSTYHHLALTSSNTYSGSGILPNATDGYYKLNPNSFKSEGTSIPISDYAFALALGRFNYAKQNYGSRYNEYLSRMGVTPRNLELQLPLYLGGGKNNISVSEVLQTAPGDEPVGTMKGHGINVTGSRRVVYPVPEHGLIISVMFVRPKIQYTQGIDRAWLKKSYLDYYQKEFAFLGMQPVYNKELWSTATDDSIFGYQQQYDEYRHFYGKCCGEFRSLLNYWHLNPIYSAQPVLNGSFIVSSAANSRRIFAVTDPKYDTIYASVYNSLSMRRPIPKFAKMRTF